jgi:flavin reductase (DIM6/NTAB) family NADH-FMN oxidoreductase RutF
MLGSGQADLARWFASAGRPQGSVQFAAVDCHPDPYTRAPLLDGALAHFACRLSGSCGTYLAVIRLKGPHTLPHKVLG